MARQGQCPVCYNYIEFESGVAYCLLCDEVYTDPEQEEESLSEVGIDDLPF